MKVVRVAKTWLGAFWCWLRQFSEDTAYERYLEKAAAAQPPQQASRGQDHRRSLLSAADFYRQRLEHKYSHITRCC